MPYTLTVSSRAKEDVQMLRASGLIPAVIYGPDTKTRSVSMDGRVFEKMYSTAGSASLINCTVEGDKEPVIVLIQEVQYEPVKGKIIHADLRQIPMNKEMHADVAVHYIGESPAVKALGGTLMTLRDELEVKCLPKDLVASLEVDITKLNTFEDRITVGDLVLPTGITVMDDVSIVLAMVTAPLTEEQLKALEEEGQKGVESVEQIEKKKKEDEDAAAAGAEEGDKAVAKDDKAPKADAGKKE